MLPNAASSFDESGLHSALRTTRIEMDALQALSDALCKPTLRESFIDAVKVISALSGA